MRSSIACARCRRSKVKCVNSGVGTICRACETSGRECTYPVPMTTAVGAFRRESAESRQSTESGQQYGDGPKKPRPKKAPTPQGIAAKESIRAPVDALDPNILTPQVWVELFEIWSLHYSTDLPFIHPPTFLQPLRQAESQQSLTNPLPAASPVALLAFLALTARFHDGLVAHHSPATSSKPSDPLIACQYYASACKARLAGNSGDGLGLPDIDRVQALAMLALHDWGNCAGQKAWVGLGVSIRYAQVLGLQYQQDLDDEPQSRASPLPQKTSNDMSSRAFVEDETKRRIFWGLFIMDRYLSSGKYRPQMLRSEDIRIQLPSSERSFMFKEKVRTSMLVSSPMDQESRPIHGSGLSPRRHGSSGSLPRIDSRVDEDGRVPRWEVGIEEGIVSRYIKAIELYGCIIRWSCSGGRRIERYAPWDSLSSWNTLNVKLNHLIDHLPRDLTLSPANTQAHIMSKTSTPFLMMHAVLLLGRMMLHREYVPFIPLRCSKPEGPLDPPLFSPDQYRIPPGFWDYSAAELFRSARALVDLVYTCHEWKVLPQTPIVGFAIYIAAFVGVYAINFPWMDPNGYMCKKTSTLDVPHQDDSGSNASRHALSLVACMKRRLRMAEGWFRTIERVHRYYVRIKKDFQRNTNVLGGSRATIGPLSIKEGGIGGGLEEFKMIEATLKEFGSLEDEDVEMSEAQVLEKKISGESEQSLGSWNAINAMPGSNASSSGNASSIVLPAGTAASPFRPFDTSISQGPPPLVPRLEQLQQPLSMPSTSMASMQQSSSPMMTPEQIDAWLNDLDTAFTSDDLSAFVEGIDWSSWAQDGNAVTQNGSWLSTVWER